MPARILVVDDDPHIALALRETEGNRAAAAARLGISLATLNRRLREQEPGSE